MLFLALLALACSTADSPAPAADAPVVATEGKAGKAEKPALDIPPPPDVAAAPADATTTTSGLAYKVLSPGTGTERPALKDKVTVNYTGWTTDGKAFDSSTKRGKPTSFAVERVVAGWTEGLQLMVVGEKTRFWIPEALAYKGKAGKPAGMLVFDVELVSITPAPKPIPAPEDVAAPGKGAKKTKSGLSYKVLQKGTGKEKPNKESVVVVDYTGWQKDGTMFDSSVSRGKPASFPLGRVIPGWTEGLQLMVVGEKTRFWIPADLAYGETAKRPGAPSGDLVFDVELKEIKEASKGPPATMTPPGRLAPIGRPGQKPIRTEKVPKPAGE